MSDLDPITAEIIRNALQTTALEMTITLQRTGRSPITNESRDFSTAIFDARGRMIAQGLGSPILMAASKWTVDAILKDFRYDLHHGDIIVNNDPYSGGAHCGDMTLAMPVFQKNKLILFPAARCHLADSGGGGDLAGGFNPKAIESCEESMRIPPLKICEAGQTREDVYRWIIRNCRIKEWTIGDIEAMIASCRIAERRIDEIMDKYGEGAVLQALDYALDYSEKRFRDEIRAWPDGTYEGVVFSDGDGKYTWDVKIKNTITVEGDSLKIDFTGTDPQTKGFANSPLGNTWCHVFLALCSTMDESIPKNDGIFRPVELITPEGTVVNPREGAAAGFCTIHPGAEIAAAVTMALSKIIPKKVGTTWDSRAMPVISGVDPRSGKRYVSLNFVTLHGGPGGTYGQDGWGGGSVIRGGMAYTTAEMTELQYPHVVEKREFTVDSGGPGKWRGGNGIETILRLVDHEALASIMVWGGRYPAVGFCGGLDGTPNVAYLKYGSDGEMEVLGGQSHEVVLRDAERMRVIRGGGGGWGNPMDRDPNAVREDILDGYVSVEGAARNYGVIVDPSTLEVDERATERLRRQRASIHSQDTHNRHAEPQRSISAVWGSPLPKSRRDAT